MNNGYFPWLGLLTAIFEITAAIWAIRISGRKSVRVLSASLLILLAVYQLLEVVICAKASKIILDDPRTLFLSRLAFIDVTWLPPLSLMLLSRIASPSPRWLKIYARITLMLAAIMSFWILVDYRFITGTICRFMYAAYSYVEPWFHIYGAFYEITQFSLIFVAIICMVRADNILVRRQIGAVLTGALLYILPAFFLGAIRPEIVDTALPSILCHFALIFAGFLVWMLRLEVSCAPKLAVDRNHLVKPDCI